MSKIAIAGAGAFGTALAIALGRADHQITLWARDPAHAAAMQRGRENLARLSGAMLPDSVTVTAEMAELSNHEALLLAVPMQALASFLESAQDHIADMPLIACCKGVSLKTGTGPTDIIAQNCPSAVPAILTGPSFAADIAKGLPTALTLACPDKETGRAMQALLSTPVLRLYRSTDTTGAELGGALKNVIAIAAGIVSGAGLGDSARAALITRGFAETSRFAKASGAQTETLSGLSGLGDMILTCTSGQSRNYQLGRSLGQGQAFDPSVTVEGAATARAVARITTQRAIDMPITSMVAAVLDDKINIEDAVRALMSRPLKEE